MRTIFIDMSPARWILRARWRRLSWLALAIAGAATAAEPPTGRSIRPVEGIMDNSFLVEEAYNQEAGVVQHILTAAYEMDRMAGPNDSAWSLSFTQEWPFRSQRHQLSYTIPWYFTKSGGVRQNGLGDVLLNYRWQAFFDEKSLTAFAPRLSLVLPTGDAQRGLGDDTTGLQCNLPFSTTLNDYWFLHANLGLTYLPNAGTGPKADLRNYQAGVSLIYAASSVMHYMVECTAAWNETIGPGGGSSRRIAAVISPGIRRAFDLKGDAQLVLGLAVPIGLTSSAPDYGPFLYFSF